MNKNKKIFYVLLSIIFLSAPLVITTTTLNGSTIAIDQTVNPAAEYDFENRREPISILVYNEYADNDPGGEWEYTMDELEVGYGYTFNYDNLSDYTNLESMIWNYDVLLIVEQELASETQMDDVATEWSPILNDWVMNDGVLICLDYYSTGSPGGYGTTTRILNNTGLMGIYNVSYRSSDPITITDSFDPLAYDVSAYTSLSGTIGFNVTDANAVFSSLGQTVVAHRYLGLGHVAMLGFDMYESNTDQRQILANAVRLTRLAVFDNSHAQFYNPWSGYFEFATHIQSNYGFAIATMNSWTPVLVESSQVLVAGTNYLTIEPFNSTEVEIVTDFVNSGGGLLIASEIWWYGNGTDPLLWEFGYERNYTAAYVSDTDDVEGLGTRPIYGTENIANHSATISTASIQMYGSTGYTAIPDDAVPLVWTDTDGTAGWNISGTFTVDNSRIPLATALHHGAGRIVTIADNNILNDDDADTDGTADFFDLDNEEFISSVMIWLSAAGIPEKTILFEESHSPYLPISSVDEFARLLSFNGLNLRWGSQFSEQLVNEADVLVIINGAESYTVSEITAIQEFVEHGGGLFMFCDWGTYYEKTNEILSAFGMEVNGTSHLTDTDDGWVDPPPSSYIAYFDDNIGVHPIMNGVDRIEIDRGPGFSTIGSGTALVVTDNDGTAGWYNQSVVTGVANSVPVIAANEFGLGRLVVIPDINFPMLMDPDSDNIPNLYDSDNEILLANAFYWLSENRAPIVEVTFPNGGEVLNGTEYIEWTAIDANGDALSFDIFVSDNSGSDWDTLATGLSGLSYEWDTTAYVDGDSYMIRVIASDGLLSSHDESDDTFEVANPDATGTTTPTGTGEPLDPTLLAILGVAALVVVIILVVILQKKKK